MNKKEGFVSSFLFLFFCVVVLFIYSCNEKTIKKNIILPEFWSLETLKNNVEDGDIILKMGYGPISKIISTQLSEEYSLSHCAIIFKKDTNLYLIHSVSGEIAESDGVQMSSIEDFYRDIKPNSLFVLRHKSKSEIRKNISTKAKYYLDKKTPFDSDFNNNDSCKLYCSELVNIALLRTYNKNYFQTKKIGYTNVYTFNSILKSNDFDIVNFPIKE